MIESQASAIQPLSLRTDSVIPAGFIFDTLIGLTILLGALYWILKRFIKPNNGWIKSTENKRIQLLESRNLTARTRVVLLEIDGNKAVVTETAQGATLQFLSKTTEQDV